MKARTVTAGISVVALLTIMIVIFRPGWSRATPAGGVDPAAYPPEYSAGLLRYDLDPSSAGVPAVSDRVVELIDTQFSDLNLPGAARGTLREAVRDRLQMLLAPDFETWKRLVLASPCDLPAGLAAGDAEQDRLIRKWSNASSVLDHSPIASGGIRVRTFEPTEGPRLGVPGTRFHRSGGGGDPAAAYPDPPAVPGVQCVEVLIPMLYRPPDGREPLPVNVALRFFRRPSETVWSPTDLFLYFDQSSFGRGLIGPIY